MNNQGNSIVWFILIPIFLAVGAYLIIYSKKRKAMLRRFAQKNGLQYTPEDNGKLETELSERFSIKDTGLVRSFMQIKDIVTDEEIFLFRCVELLDLNPYGTSQNSHQNHICISFNTHSEINLFFITNKDGNHNNLYPKDKILNEDGYFQKIQSVVIDNPPKRSITISFQRGKALMYVNPLVTGGEKEEDLEYLLMIGKKIKNVVK